MMVTEYGCTVNARDVDGKTALRLAIDEEVHSHIIRELMDGGADACLPDNEGETPLEAAISSSWGRDLTVMKMLRAGQEGALAYRSPRGYTSLHHAIVARAVPLVKWLLKQGASTVDLADFTKSLPVITGVLHFCR